MEKGRTTLPAESLDTMADRCEEQLRRVPDGTLRLANPHTYKVSISSGMNDLRNRLMKHYLSNP
jgi:nicotinate phosphoribosyltransferase